jgi:membrane fusion protein, multidrug efflux system
MSVRNMLKTPRPYVAEVDRAYVHSAAAQAWNGYATTDAARANRLLADNAIAERDLDEAKNASHEAAANLKAAQAALEAARVSLSSTNIVAPVSGNVSRAELTLGNVVSTGASAPLLTTLVSVSPIYASFDADEQTSLRYLNHDSRTSVPVSLGFANREGLSRDGKIDSVDNLSDTGSGEVRVGARFDNADGMLVPGRYRRVKIGGRTDHPAVLVNPNAIGSDQNKKVVTVADAENRVRHREVTPRAKMNDLTVITMGLAPGESIVANGLQRIHPNDSVRAKPVAMSAASNASKSILNSVDAARAPDEYL